ncbi:LysR family transcriptional regulator [Salmonella enterica subsp. enterica serovar Saintpaul]|nr:LysR family transcriptional regulator [Salmonella enterica subsp. enterica serovar Saintpaul]EFR6822729.1 LysR family transcriptional regulator [Salmonella enterica]EHF6859295.1 LysR family transcriptional regulator [Salmonella enterica subsp. enterica serovar Panama]ELS1935946.1 LysR family transcriptional regulator [Salmonella enterica]
MRLDLSDLKLVVCIADAGSITHGARDANLAVGSASERLKSIEEDTGVKLFFRHPRGVSLTEIGEILVDHARELLSRQEQLKAELSAYAKGVTGKVRLYANTSAMVEFLPCRLAKWLLEHPRVTIELEERTSTDIINSISNGIAEAGLVSDAVDACELTLEPIADDRLALIVPAIHPLGFRDNISLLDAISEPFIGLYPGNALQDHISGHAREYGHSLNYRIRMSNFEGICEMVSSGIGVGVLPVSVAERFSKKFHYHILPLTDQWARRRICICYKTPDSLSPAMTELIDFLRIKDS